MKKITIFVLLLALAISIVGCSAKPTPDNCVKGFFDAAKTFDFDKMNIYVKTSDANGVNNLSDKLSDDAFSNAFFDYLKSSAAKASYRIDGSQINGDTATVKVTCKFIDCSGPVGSVFKELMSQMFTLSFTNPQATDEERDAMFSQVAIQMLANTQDTLIEKTFDIPCTKVNNEWKIETVNTDLQNVITSNFLQAITELSSAFEQ